MLIPLLVIYSKNHPVGEGGVTRLTEWRTEFLDFCKKRTGSWDQDGSLIIAHRTGSYAIEDWLPLEIDDFCATGSGYQHAEAAMYLGHDTEAVVDVAVNMAYGCGGDVVTKGITT